MTQPKWDRPIRVLMITSQWPRHAGHTSHFIARQAHFLRSAGVDVDIFPFRGGRNPLRYLTAWALLQGRLARGRYDLVHAQFGQSGLLALPKRLPLVVTFRGDDLLGIIGSDGRYTRAGRVLQWLSQLVARQADTAILVSAHMQPYLEPRVPAHVVPSGIDFDHFRCLPQAEARRRVGLPLDKRLVLFVGDTADTRKRFPLARQAVEILSRTLPAELIVAWRVAHEDMPAYMNACDALVFTSMLEGSPNAVKEALACNLPVVSVAVADVPLRLRGIEGCEVCADERPEALAAALERVLQRGRRAASREAVRTLDERVLTQQVIAIYRSALNGANHRGERH
jgi:glycosyltransferase involved in cell wall biosynthesis